MKAIFGPYTQRVLTFLTDLWRLSPEEINTVTSAWREADDLDRAEAWAQLHRAASRNERYRILAAASVARRQAMDVASLNHRTDWAFWAAAWDAAAAIAADDGQSGQYEILTAPLTTVLPYLSGRRRGAQVPAQRPSQQAVARRGAARRGQTRAEHPGQHALHRTARRGADAR